MANKSVWRDARNRVSVKLYPRALDITWGTDPRYWTYFHACIDGKNVEVAKLENVCWLDVKGEVDISQLTAGTDYEILFDIELNRGARGWDVPVMIENNTPFGLTTKFEMTLQHLIGKGRTEISIGKLKLSCACIPPGAPKAAFTLFQHDGRWKNGLIIHGLTIRPVS